MKISKQGWEQAYYGKWLKAQERTRKKSKFDGYLGWGNLAIDYECSYCRERRKELGGCCCGFCTLDEICAKQYSNYIDEMRESEPDWKKANELVDQIVEAIRQDGLTWGYLKEDDK
jgi:hypothetical protein